MQTLGGCATNRLGLCGEHRASIILILLVYVCASDEATSRKEFDRHEFMQCACLSDVQAFSIGPWPRIETTPTSATSITMVPPLSRCYMHERTSTACDQSQRRAQLSHTYVRTGVGGQDRTSAGGTFFLGSVPGMTPPGYIDCYGTFQTSPRQRYVRTTVHMAFLKTPQGEELAF